MEHFFFQPTIYNDKTGSVGPVDRGQFQCQSRQNLFSGHGPKMKNSSRKSILERRSAFLVDRDRKKFGHPWSKRSRVVTVALSTNGCQASTGRSESAN